MAAVIGIVAGVVCYVVVAQKSRFKVDDALDVFGVHGVGGLIGTVMLGIFASKAWNPNGVDGLLAGNWEFFLKQCVAIIFSSVWAFAFTYGMLWVINKFVRVRVDAKAEDEGLDEAIHGEQAYI